MKYPASTNLCRARTEMSLMRGRMRMIEAIYTQPKRLRTNIAEESRDALAMLRRAGLQLPLGRT